MLAKLPLLLDTVSNRSSEYCRRGIWSCPTDIVGDVVPIVVVVAAGDGMVIPPGTVVVGDEGAGIGGGFRFVGESGGDRGFLYVEGGGVLCCCEVAKVVEGIL